MGRLVKEMIILGLAGLASLNLMLPSLLPDFLPFIGWLDEGASTLILINTFRYYGVDLTNLYARDKTVVRRRHIPRAVRVFARRQRAKRRRHGQPFKLIPQNQFNAGHSEPGAEFVMLAALTASSGRISAMAEHFLDDSVTQPFWDNSVEPRLEIDPGDTVVFDCAEPTGQITPDWTSDDLANIDFSKIHALNGSVFVKGAQPGDTLEVEILDMQHKGWGWSAHLVDFGLLAEDFNFNYLHHWRLEGAHCLSDEMPNVDLPFQPHPGCIGVGPKEPGRLDTIPPRANGGNMDVCDMSIGSTVWLPVFVEGALFATGDCHSGQGQGEVSGTGIESPMTMTMRINLRKDMAIKEVQVRRTSPMSKLDSKGYHITTAHGPDLMENAKNALRYMIDWLEAAHGLTRSQAYVLCSAAGDLKISEIVDVPNWIVSMHFPLAAFR